MRAAVYHGPGDVRIESVPDPASPGPGELTLQVTRAGICGSDASEYLDGPHFIPLTKRHAGSGHVGPLILGHEFTGRIVAAGPGAAPFQIGQRVIPGTGIWCEQCAWCLAGRGNLCARYYTLGLHAAGGLAEYASVPARVCQLVPDACGDDAAAMAQPLAVALHALRRSGALPGQAVAFVGA
ncbi:MAG: alcohol dehydrogenase catalytic domain-containing protein, partial [Chloroflexi bacterium]|nr:alcohol dehydrogenase catalytic domain-containing protein [Chloroflexota bacterium]